MAIKKVEFWRIDAFKLLYWRRLLRVPWTSRRSNQSILREINHKYSLEGLMLKLKFHYWSSDVNSWLIGKVPDAGKDWGKKKKKESEDEMDAWHHRCNGHELGQTSGEVRDREALSATVHGVKKSWTQLGNWTIAMLPMANLTSHSRMSIIRWVTTPIWLFGSLLLLFLI